eukprot:3316246-Prymnesium_polylepis.1
MHRIRGRPCACRAASVGVKTSCSKYESLSVDVLASMYEKGRNRAALISAAGETSSSSSKSAVTAPWPAPDAPRIKGVPLHDANKRTRAICAGRRARAR